MLNFWQALVIGVKHLPGQPLTLGKQHMNFPVISV